ncbi:MAG TPA: hypothetical protein VGM12_05495 [Trebonia sp.]
MSTHLNVARYHLIQRGNFLVMPWAWLAFGFCVDLVIFALIPAGHHDALTAHGTVQVTDVSGRDAGGLGSIFAVFLSVGITSVARSLPFALTLGVSRRSYYLGTALTGGVLAVAYGLTITLLQAIERATGGWGVSAHIFQVPYILDGPWYLTWLTSTVALALLFTYGMWIGVVHRRWNVAGTMTFGAAQVTVAVAAIWLVTWGHAWSGTGRFFTALSAAGLTGVLAALACVLLAGGYLTVRRAAV